MFMAWVWLKVLVSPQLAPAKIERPAPRQILVGLVGCVPIILLLLAILGGMYFGIVTPTEAAAFGCLGALLIGIAIW